LEFVKDPRTFFQNLRVSGLEREKKVTQERESDSKRVIIRHEGAGNSLLGQIALDQCSFVLRNYSKSEPSQQQDISGESALSPKISLRIVEPQSSQEENDFSVNTDKPSPDSE